MLRDSVMQPTRRVIGCLMFAQVQKVEAREIFAPYWRQVWGECSLLLQFPTIGVLPVTQLTAVAN